MFQALDARALYKAVVEEGDEEKISRILDKNAKLINEVIDYEYAAGVLHCATEKGLTKTIRQLLLRKGVNVNMLNKNGCTPLYYSCSFGHADVTKLLLDHKADATIARTVKHGRGLLERIGWSVRMIFVCVALGM